MRTPHLRRGKADFRFVFPVVTYRYDTPQTMMRSAAQLTSRQTSLDVTAMPKPVEGHSNSWLMLFASHASTRNISSTFATSPDESQHTMIGLRCTLPDRQSLRLLSEASCPNIPCERRAKQTVSAGGFTLRRMAHRYHAGTTSLFMPTNMIRFLTC